MPVNSRIPKLRELGVRDRRARIAEHAGVDPAAFDPENGIGPEQADQMIENAVGVFGVPLGVATNLTVNGRDYLVPMAIEEPSVVAAASNAARMARGRGGLRASTTGPVMIAQIQIVDVPNPEAARFRILEAREEIIARANEQDPVLVDLGGGARAVEARAVPTASGTHLVVHLAVDVRDAMGANAVNTMAEALAPRLAELAGGRPLLRILSNKADRRLVRVRGEFDAGLLGGPRVVDDIVLASDFAAADPYRAATHNKGIMNGISAVVLATGNDTRAVEAGCHAHAARDGRYTALSRFEKNGAGNLVGTLEVPMAVGLVGGATRAHPTARAAIALLGVDTAVELGEVIAAVGLVQNLAACRALAAEGIQRGHMALHARTLAVSAGAAGAEISEVAARMVAAGRIREEYAREVLGDLRGAPA
ncbi:hydroxymethylglutaryl-CoA reductase, degradative [Nocardiopsis changdeensis]|uniref:3-hydroxy-3-methylglutaryl coenzyme A reductase n=1 Tax=Nocardiopsis changdeensis TaxID=2831969 RepID=A0ABX8BS44_9ACTN|nr:MULTISPECIES: hydroxymethylglutaryl-CoA reductase, degradative [Nocardiopsis]QUX25065.1 hydroxymethylglutaryl-CoA reductase, degradative [Nocardiopsis changdeensis]QYX35451.1 hydroxymethylglutaryl-CoA reductase, degradative [Nocardiopsis sp. MT53]